MEAISLKLPKELLEDSAPCAEALKMSRGAYVRQAIEQMNRKTRAQIRSQRLASASLKVRKESKSVNKEFEAIDRDPDVKARTSLADGLEPETRYRTRKDTPCSRCPVAGSSRCGPSFDTGHSADHHENIRHLSRQSILLRN